MIRFKLYRYSSGKEATLGLLFWVGSAGNLVWLCYTLEDEHRNAKIYGETRIPAGTYQLEERLYGDHYRRYKARWPDWHEGMIELLSVPGFKHILIHIGNKDDDTAGCILVGDSAHQNISDEGMVGASTTAYKRIYPIIRLGARRGYSIEIIDMDES